MTVTVNLYYTGTNGAAQAFAKEMLETGVVAQMNVTSIFNRLMILKRSF